MFTHNCQHIICVENLLGAWKEFQNGKRRQKDVQEFQLHLMDNIINLHKDLKNKIYKHGRYEAFSISDPRQRNIHKASVRDRLLHHALYRQLYLYFDKTFIADSYSCRRNKGTHRAMNRFRGFSNKVSKSNTKTVWVFKSDIRKFFASMEHFHFFGIRYVEIMEVLLWCLSEVQTKGEHCEEGREVFPSGKILVIKYSYTCSTKHQCTGMVF